MIVGHVTSIGKNVIFSFHMPLFIIASGMFFKKEENCKKLIKKIVKTLILPYILTISIMYIMKFLLFKETISLWTILQQIILSYSNKKTFFTNVDKIGVLWFIPFLAVCKVLYFIINKISKGNDILSCIICLICTIAGLFLTKVNIFLPWSFDIALACMIFYYIGYIFMKYNILEEILNNRKYIIGIIVLYCICLQFGYTELAERLYSGELICYITAICGTLIVFKISKIIEKMPKFIPDTLQWFGKNSMYVLCIHFLEGKLMPYKAIFHMNKNLTLLIIKILFISMSTFLLVNIKNIMSKLKNKIKLQKISG